MRDLLEEAVHELCIPIHRSFASENNFAALNLLLSGVDNIQKGNSMTGIRKGRFAEVTAPKDRSVE